MKFTRSVMSALALLMVSAVSYGDVVVVDFEDNAIDSGTQDGSLGGYSVMSNGCSFTTSDSWSGLENELDGSVNGSTHIFGSSITMTCGGSFDLLTWHQGEDYVEFGSGDGISNRLDLFFADGTSLLDILVPLDGSFGFQGWQFADPSLPVDLISVRWFSDGTFGDEVPYQFALDNIRVDVPEPGTLALLGLGLVGIGASRRRRSKA